jgi:hypothetical protein
VDEDRVGEAEASVAFAVPEKTARDREQNGELSANDVTTIQIMLLALNLTASLHPEIPVATAWESAMRSLEGDLQVAWSKMTKANN